VPCSCALSPAKIFNSEVLPLPLVPVMRKISPELTTNILEEKRLAEEKAKHAEQEKIKAKELEEKAKALEEKNKPWYKF
jgi:hypothetical protein